eukprot:scaffold151524_cov52-Attheya_sp.AAC.3
MECGVLHYFHHTAIVSQRTDERDTMALRLITEKITSVVAKQYQSVLGAQLAQTGTSVMSCPPTTHGYRDERGMG